jgi:hypothetical protein
VNLFFNTKEMAIGKFFKNLNFKKIISGAKKVFDIGSDIFDKVAPLITTDKNRATIQKITDMKDRAKAITGKIEPQFR